MNWWNDPTFLAWLSIALVILTTILSLYYQSDNFSRLVLERTTKIRLFFTYQWKTFFLTGLGVAGIFMVGLGYYEWFLSLYAILSTIMIILVLSEKRQVFDVVSCRLGNYESEKGAGGINFIKWQDGIAIRELVNEEYVRRTDVKKRQGYIYLSFDEKIAHNFRASKRKDVYIIVEYLDNKNYGNFHVHYDSTDKDNPMPAFKGVDHYAQFTGSNEWRSVVWKITDGKFKRSQQQRADFRIRGGKANSQESPSGTPEVFDVYIRKVTVVAV